MTPLLQHMINGNREKLFRQMNDPKVVKFPLKMQPTLEYVKKLKVELTIHDNAMVSYHWLLIQAIIAKLWTKRDSVLFAVKRSDCIYILSCFI